jgi:Acetyltransferase (GNAT) domain
MIRYSTARLVLRRPEDSDVEPLMAMDADPEVMQYIRSGAIILPDRDRARQAVTRWRKQWDEQGFGMCSVIVPRSASTPAGSRLGASSPGNTQAVSQAARVLVGDFMPADAEQVGACQPRSLGIERVVHPSAM